MIAGYLEMGGYGRYVWPAFGITLAVMAGLLIASIRALRANEARLSALQAELPANPPGVATARQRRVGSQD